MKFFNYLFLPLVITAIPFTATAETIYKSVDESGAAVFSDKRTPDAEKIIVQPNVVDVNIPDMPATTHQTTHKPKVMQTTHGNSGHNQSTISGSGTVPVGNLKRKIQNRTNGKGINHPVTRPAARAGGHR